MYINLCTGLEVSKSLRLSEFVDNRRMKVVSFLTLHTDHFYLSGNIPGIHFY